MDKTTHRTVGRGVLIAGGILVGLFLLVSVAETWIGHKIRRTVQRQVSAMTGGALQAEIGDVSFSLVNRSVTLKKLRIRSDSALLPAFDPTLRSLSVDVRRLSVGGIRTSGAKGSRKLTIGELELDAPRVDLVRRPADSVRAAAGAKHAADRLSGNDFREVAVGELVLQNGDIRYCRQEGGNALCHALNGLSLQTSRFRLYLADSSGHPAFAGDFRTSVNRIDYQFDNGAMQLEIDTLAVDSRDSTLHAAGVRLIPQYPKDEFASLVGNHADWTQVIAGGVGFVGVDFARLLRDRTLRIDSVTLGHAEISSYKNRKIPQKPRTKKLFYESLQRFPLKTEIRRISLHGITAEYEELASDGVTPGRIRFTELNGDFYGLTNVKTPDTTFYRLVASGKLMGKGELHATFMLPVDSLTNHFEVEGHLGALDLIALNGIIEPLARAKVNSGHVNGMDFRIVGTDRESSVHLELLYDDLSVSLVSENGRRIKERPLLTFVVDEMLIRHSNPDDKGLRLGEGTTERNMQRSQFNYLWKSLLPGIKQTVIGSNRADRRHDRR